MTTKLSEILGSAGGSSGVTVILENRDPNASDSAQLGVIWINENTNRYFVITDNTTGNCTWIAGDGGDSVVVDTRPPNSSDLGNLGDAWIDTSTNKIYFCTDDTPGSTVWDTDTQVQVLTDTRMPNLNDDSYPVGTHWIDTTTDTCFVCVNNASGAAIWRAIIPVIESSVNPTITDYNYPLGTIWINNEVLNHKTYFILIDNTVDHAIWSKNETDVYWVTDPLITGSVIAECDETIYTYNAANSLSAIDESTTITYNWSLTNGVLSSATGSSVNVYFTNAQNNSVQTLSCYASDDLGNISETIDFEITVRVVNVVSGLTLSLPNVIYTNESSFYDISVAYTGGDYTLNYFWESSQDGGLNWTSVFFVNPNLKLSEAVITSNDETMIRCTVTNLGGSVTETSALIPTIDISTDVDSTYLDTDLHTLENKDYHALMQSSSVITVPTVIFETNDRIIVNDNQDNVINVNNVFDTQMNLMTDEKLLNADYTSFLTTCTLMGNKVIIAYNDSNVSPKGVLVVGTYNGDSISFGDPIEFNNAYSQWITLLPLVDNQVIVAYRDDGNNNLGGCRIASVEGNRLTLGAEYVFNSVDTDHISMCKIDDNHFAVAYSDYGTGNLGTLVVAQVTGLTMTFGTQQVYTNSSYFNSVTLIDSNKLAIAFQDDTNSNYGSVIIAGVTGTTLSLGTVQTFSTNGYTNYIKCNAIDTNKIAITFQDIGTSGHGFVIIGDVVSTVVTFGTAQLFENTVTTYIDTAWANDRLMIAYQDGTNAGKTTFASISGTTAIIKPSVTFNEDESDFISVFEMDNKLVIVFKDGGDADQGKLMVYTPYKQELTLENETVTTDVDIVRLNTEYVLPIIAQEPTQDVFEKVEMRIQTNRNNIFDVVEDSGKMVYNNYEIEPYVIGDRLFAIGATNVYGIITQLDRSVIAGTGETVSFNENVFSNTNTQQTASAFLDKFIITAFRDNSSSGSVVLGEVKYDDVYWDNKLSFSALDVDYISCTKISDTQAIVAYQDINDGFGKMFVATIEDEVLSIGGVFQFNAAATEHIDVAMFDTNKFIISFQDVGDLNKGKCIIGSVSGSTPTFGAEQEFSSNNVTYTSIIAISTTKIAVAYRDIDNGGFGTVKVGNIVGTNITFGTGQVFYSGSSTYIDVEFLSTNKIVVKYTDYANNNYGATVVGVVSGTNVTWGVSQYFNNNETYYSNIIATENDVFMVVYDNYIGAKAYGRVGSVSGTTITFDTSNLLNNGTTSHIDLVKVDRRKTVMTYADQANSYKGTSQIVRRDIDLIRTEITIDQTLPTGVTSVELLPYIMEASTGMVQSFDSTEYYHTDLHETYSPLNANTMLTTGTITTSGNFFYSRIRAVNTDEFDKFITRIDVDFWIED